MGLVLVLYRTCPNHMAEGVLVGIGELRKVRLRGKVGGADGI